MTVILVRTRFRNCTFARLPVDPPHAHASASLGGGYRHHSAGRGKEQDTFPD